MQEICAFGDHRASCTLKAMQKPCPPAGEEICSWGAVEGINQMACIKAPTQRLHPGMLASVPLSPLLPTLPLHTCFSRWGWGALQNLLSTCDLPSRSPLFEANAG